MTIETLLLKFRQSRDYTTEMLIRDLIDYAGDVEKRFAALEGSFDSHSGEYPFFRTGSWSPTFYFGSTQAASHAYQRGTWARIGNLVHVQMDVALSSKGTGVGSATIRGLPFYPLANQGAGMAVSYMSNMALAAGEILSLLAHSTGNSDALILRRTTNLSSATVSDAQLNNNSRIIANGTYITNEP